MYDARGRQAVVVNPDGSFVESRFDSQGNRTVQKTPFDSTIYEYDQLNRIDAVIASSGTTQYFYNAVGNRDSVVNTNGTSAGYHYDNLNRLINVTNYNPVDSVLSSYTYILNNAGIRTAVTESDGSVVDYGYDDLYRLTSETRTGILMYTIAYTYDNVGNRLTQTKDGVTTSYTYNNRDQLTVEDSAGVVTSYTYDNAGRMISKTKSGDVTTYTWVDNDRMSSVTGTGVNSAYEYNADGLRIKTNDGIGTKCYLYDMHLPYGQVVAEYDGNGSLIADYVYGLDRVSMRRGGADYTYLADGQGSVRQITNAAGTVTDTYDYFAFGEVLNRTGTTQNEFTYNSEQFDPNAGFYYLRARWYDPERGRFASVDPFNGDPQVPISLHSYLYANASPVSFRDPTGQFSLLEMSITSSISGMLGGATIGYIRGGVRGGISGAIVGAVLGPILYSAVTVGGYLTAAAMGISVGTGLTVSNTVAMSVFTYFGLQDYFSASTPREKAAALTGIALMVAGAGASYVASPKQITVVGSLKDCEALTKIPGFNVLQGQNPNATEAENVIWLQEAIGSKDIVYVRTDPVAWAAFMESIGKRSRFVYLEMPMLQNPGSGYIQIGPFMLSGK